MRPVRTPSEAKLVARETLPPAETIPEIPKESVRTEPPISDLLLRLNDVYFDLDRHDLSADARHTLEVDAQVLNQIQEQAEITFNVEGHCDERGSAEYNLALGAMRADAAKDFLVSHGVSSRVIKTTSYGKERPQCTDPTEACWQKNRRAHLAANP